MFPQDDRLAGALDRLAKYGIDDVLSEVVVGYLRPDACPTEYQAHTDMTTLSLYGAYDVEPQFGAPRPNYGHSKAHQPDLKQIVYGMTLQGALGVPMCVSMFDGNTSGQVANRFHIEQLAGLLPPEHDVTLVLDCKLFDPDSIGHVLDAAFHFLTLVPRSYALHVIESSTTRPSRSWPAVPSAVTRTPRQPWPGFRRPGTTKPKSRCSGRSRPCPGLAGGAQRRVSLRPRRRSTTSRWSQWRSTSSLLTKRVCTPGTSCSRPITSRLRRGRTHGSSRSTATSTSLRATLVFDGSKDPRRRRRMFRKTPHRIAALGLVFILALMVRNYIQWTLRTALRDQDQTLPTSPDASSSSAAPERQRTSRSR